MNTFDDEINILYGFFYEIEFLGRYRTYHISNFEN